MVEKKYNYFYKITNNINNHFYYGIHSTDNINDGYMGSGRRLNRAFKKYGIANFNKEIIKYFPTREDASDYEAEMVTEELVKSNDCYNCRLGGEDFKTSGMVDVYDIEEGVTKWVSQEIYHSQQTRYISIHKGYVLCKSKETNKYKKVISEEFYKNRDKYIALAENKVSVKDKLGNYYLVSSNDERYLNGELVAAWTGKHHSTETKKKQRETFKKIKHQQGIRNSHYGTHWIMKENESKCVKKEELNFYLENGWKRGRKCKETSKAENIDLNEVLKMRENGITWENIEKKLNISHYTMNKFKKINGLIV